MFRLFELKSITAACCFKTQSLVEEENILNITYILIYLVISTNILQVYNQHLQMIQNLRDKAEDTCQFCLNN